MRLAQAGLARLGRRSSGSDRDLVEVEDACKCQYRFINEYDPVATLQRIRVGSVRRNGPLDEGFGVKLRRPVHGCIMHDYGHLHCHLITMTGPNGDKRHVRDDFG
ncbi:hypothetical protein E4U09_002455 [Claviceps aff. purpurea]|uniref:Uncharacterized protein n=1 Tax=Claviceps aff. purpurea TaxID=1967640 RepID=A0A9P7QGN8_9HYPO|nr:hypothetical protein E4U09_002455 [Claviceps aff. purpurea]